MAEWIDRQALLKNAGMVCDHIRGCNYGCCNDCAGDTLVEMIENAPTVELKRVRCSSCRKVYVQPVAGAHHCPFCAKWDKWIEWDGEDDEYYPPETVTNMRGEENG